MTKCLLCMVSVVIGLLAAEGSAAPVTVSGSMARNIPFATAKAKEVPLVLVRRGGGGGGRAGGGLRGGGGFYPVQPNCGL